MKKLHVTRSLAVFCLGLIALNVSSQGITTPRVPSPAAEVAQTIGLSKITVNYSRPSVKGREVWGKLVPYGWNVQAFGAGNSAPWRAGANENTTITFTHPAKVEGTTVPAGRYGLFFVINQDNTGEVILSKDSKSWGSFFYDQKNDLMRAKIKLNAISPTELLTYEFDNITKNSTDLLLNWEKKQFPVKIEFATDDIVMANAEEELKGPVGFNWQGYNSAATYAVNNKVNYDEALVWAEKAVAQNKSFATLNTKANILKAMGKNDESDKTMSEAMALSTEVELNLYGYQLMNNGQQDKAIEVFILNTKRFPKSPNTWDSLGEGYVTKGDSKNAITNFKKSLSMNPPDAVKQNSEKFLKQLGAL
jgi:TolA-binding protein